MRRTLGARRRGTILLAAVLSTATPAVASFTGHAESAGSGARAADVFRPVAGATPPAVTSPARFGATLTASPGDWRREATSFAERWLRCDADGSACAATDGAPTVTAADIGHRMRVEVTARNAGGSAVATSATSPGVPPAPQGAGTIAGTAKVGATLTFSSGGWTTNPALAAATRRAWWRCPTTTWGPDACTKLAATGTAYTPVSADVGAILRVVETTEQGGFAADVVSGAGAPVTAASVRLAAVAQHATGPAYGHYVVGRIADERWDTEFLTSGSTAPVRAGQWVRIDFRAVRTLTRYRVNHRILPVAGHPTFAYAIEASTDGASWTSLRMPSPATAPSHLTNGDVTLPAPVRARFLRLRASTNTGTGWVVYGLEGWGS